MEVLRDRLEIAEGVDVLENFKRQGCEAFRRNGSIALGFGFFDIFGLGSISSSEQLNDFCLSASVNVDRQRLRTRFSSGLSVDATHFLSSCAPDGIQATIESLTDDMAKVRVSFVDYTQNAYEEPRISGIAPAGACTLPEAKPRIGPMGVEVACRRDAAVADRGRTITLTLDRPQKNTAAESTVHIPSDRFVRTKFTIHEFRTEGRQYWRCVEAGVEPPVSGANPLPTDIICMEDFCEQRPRATWYYFCKAELGFANRISPSGASILKYDWQTKLEGNVLGCRIDGKSVGEVTCSDNRCRSRQFQKAVCYSKYAPTENLPGEQ
jgi:hypothetical protein